MIKSNGKVVEKVCDVERDLYIRRKEGNERTRM
jgi:hypothetical protein